MSLLTLLTEPKGGNLVKFLPFTCADDGCLRVPTEAVLEDPGELAVSVGDVGRHATAQLLDDLKRITMRTHSRRSKSLLPVLES